METIIMTPDVIAQIIEEIKADAEVARRARMQRRHKFYQDGGKEYLLEQINREFSKEAIPEMRICPINLVRKIVDKRSVIYQTPPIRTTKEQNDQALVDYYTNALALNVAMQKANRYFNLFANTALYVRPVGDKLKFDIVPPHLYSITPNPWDRTKVDVWTFSAFLEGDNITPDFEVPAATGSEGFSRKRGSTNRGDKIASQEANENINRVFMLWTDMFHGTTNEDGVLANPRPDIGPDQYINPIAIAPIVNLAKERDNEPWATQFEDAIDICMSLMLGWTDLLTIAKHQGFSILTIVSKEEPKQLKIGVNKAVWLRAEEGQPTPSISYVTGNSPLAEYKAVLLDLLALLLSTQQMPPSSAALQSGSSFQSGFHALIEMSDILAVIEQDKPYLRDAEKQLWELIKRWHNFMFDTGMLNQEASSFGKFSDSFEVDIAYRDIKPIESEQDRIKVVQDLMNMGLMTRLDAMKKLHPDLSDEAILEKVKAVDDERKIMIAGMSGENLEV